MWASSNTVQGISRAIQSQLRAARPTCSTRLEGQRALEEIDRLEKGTVSHLSFVFPIRGLQCCRVVGDNIIKHERLPSLWAFMASVSISTVFHGWVSCPLGLQRSLGERHAYAQAPENARYGVRQGALADWEKLSVCPSLSRRLRGHPGSQRWKMPSVGWASGSGCVQNSNTVNPLYLSHA